MKYRIIQSFLPALAFCIFAMPLLGQVGNEGQPKTPSIPPAGAVSPVERAIEMNVTEINLAKEAETRAQNAHVKAFAQMMILDHTEALAKLRMVYGAPAEEVKPNTEHQKTADRLLKLSGPDFDREYIGEMVTSHQVALTFFEQQSRQTTQGLTGANPTINDREFAKVAADLVPVVRMHLEEAKKIQTELGRLATPSRTN